MTIHLPGHLVSRQPTGTPDGLRTIPPTILAPSTSDSSAYAVGTLVVRIRTRLEAVPAEIDGVPVLFVTDREGKAVHVLADSRHGITEVVGWTADQLDEIRTNHFGGLGVGTAKAAAAGTVVQLSNSIDGNLDNTFHATRATAGGDREIARLVALSASMDDNGTGGNTEVDRLAKLGDSLSDG
ncbi:hypothetical protein [Microbacterium sp. SL75]|uniref:hypothetical protein n=1 Tax=Microbacterium sp. SL75 TaxID=2995140 RepID=UPI00226EADA8|nr:hypothetical protein [Microbacterium sp. SL75]WAC68549.1 hypothetical protein OVA17_13240 [Microbacterium sp. SL75]